MIEKLYIRNFGIIKETELHLCPAFNVLTGETGAGKSMIIAAMNLVFGRRLNGKTSIWPEEKTIVELTVAVPLNVVAGVLRANEISPEVPLILRREISPAGRSRAFVNDTPTALNVLKEIAALIVDISEQHQVLSIFNKQKRLSLVDDFAGHQPLVARYHRAFVEEQELRNRRDRKRKALNKLQEEQDYYLFQLSELEELNYEEGEEKALEDELKLLENAEEIKGALFEAAQILGAEEYGAMERVEEAASRLRAAAQYSDKIDALNKQLEEISFSLADIHRQLEREFDFTEHNPSRLAEIEERLSEIYRLTKKHHCSQGDQLPAVARDYRKKLSSYEDLQEEVKQLEYTHNQAFARLQELAQALTKARKAVTQAMSERTTALLQAMAIPSAHVRMEIKEAEEWHESGKDELALFFTANKGVEADEVESVASGGELSRLMLALKSLIGAKTGMPTLIFDEIDSGISGTTATRVAQLMKKLSQNTQLIVVSHLPQIASLADRHIEIYKQEEGDKTISGVKILSPEERVEAIATMLSGKKNSLNARQTAEEMLRAGS